MYGRSCRVQKSFRARLTLKRIPAVATTRCRFETPEEKAKFHRAEIVYATAKPPTLHQ